MQTNKWSSAAMSGLLLALVTVAAMAIQTVITPSRGVVWAIILIKLIVNIWLVSYFIKEFAKSSEVFTYRDGFSYGFIVCLFSSFICAVALLLVHTIVSPETFETQMDVMVSAMSQTRPEAAETIINMQQSGVLLAIVVIFSFLYYLLFGLIVSAIVANFSKKGNTIF